MKKKTLTILSIALAIVTAGFFIAGRSEASTAVQDMRGRWDGFIAAMGDPPQLFRTEILTQTNRRFTGFAEPPEPVAPISIEGTVSASGKVNYQGGPDGNGSHAVGKTNLTDYGDGAAILSGHLTRFSNDGTFIVPCVLVLRPFEGSPPDPVRPARRYLGSIAPSADRSTASCCSGR